MAPDPLTDDAPDCPSCGSDRAAWLTPDQHILHCPACHYEAADVEL